MFFLTLNLPLSNQERIYGKRNHCDIVAIDIPLVVLKGEISTDMGDDGLVGVNVLAAIGIPEGIKVGVGVIITVGVGMGVV
jgi:hypothetical protein